MDPDANYFLACQHLHQLRRRADATRLARAARRSPDHPSLRRRPGEGTPRSPGGSGPMDSAA